MKLVFSPKLALGENSTPSLVFALPALLPAASLNQALKSSELIPSFMTNFIHFIDTLKIGMKQSFLGDQTRVQVQGDIRDIFTIGEGGLFSSHLAILPKENPQLVMGNGCQTHFIRGIWQHFALKNTKKYHGFMFR
jgi:hypothetical protein